jgi:hypothetical protein
MKILSLVCVVLFVCCSACVSTKLNGSFSIESSSLGQKSFLPNACFSGDREYFLGVDLKNKTDPLQVRILQDPVQGTFVKIVNDNSDKRTEVLFDQASCKVLRGDLKQTKWKVNDIRDMSGELEADCSTGNGDTIKGRVTFVHCH